LSIRRHKHQLSKKKGDFLREVRKVNEVESLLQRRFKTFNVEERLELKRLSAHGPLDVIINPAAGQINRGFNVFIFPLLLQEKLLAYKGCHSFG